MHGRIHLLPAECSPNEESLLVGVPSSVMNCKPPTCIDCLQDALPLRCIRKAKLLASHRPKQARACDYSPLLQFSPLVLRAGSRRALRCQLSLLRMEPIFKVQGGQRATPLPHAAPAQTQTAQGVSNLRMSAQRLSSSDSCTAQAAASLPHAVAAALSLP